MYIVWRAAILAMVELSAYETLKPALARFFSLASSSFVLHAMTALIASFLSALASNPFDMARSRMMNQPRNSDGTGLYYRNTLDCINKSVRREGWLVLLAGFTAFFLRLGPNTIITFMAMEKLRVILTGAGG
jgi:Mitochondrial carrier protein